MCEEGWIETSFFNISFVPHNVNDLILVHNTYKHNPVVTSFAVLKLCCYTTSPHAIKLNNKTLSAVFSCKTFLKQSDHKDSHLKN